MNGLELGEAVKARLEALIPSRPVYVGAVPDGSVPLRYIVVWISDGPEGATRACGRVNALWPMVTVTSVARGTAPDRSVREAAWASTRVRSALRNWQPEGRWSLTHERGSGYPQRDESVPDTTYTVAEQFSLRSTV